MRSESENEAPLIMAGLFLWALSYGGSIGLIIARAG